MDGFENKLQALMDEFYAEWNKDENKSKGKWDILEGFSPAHQAAVAFGNFNYQVENGGLSQWIYNGYFHDDAEKLTGFLEKGADLDERCREILTTVYKLDQCARDTDCGRDGYYRDPDDYDGDSNFIGDMINCDKFDAWYYEHCGKEDWWQIVAQIIEKVDGRDLSQIVSQDGEVAATKPTLRLYIENANDNSIGGFTMPLPTTKDDLQPFLEGAEITDFQDIRIDEVSSEISRVGHKLYNIIEENGMTPSTLDELNYLAARLADLGETGCGIFSANIEAGQNCGSIAEMINLAQTDNINRFDCWPAYSPQEYGDIMVNQFMQDAHAIAFNRLKESEDPDDRALAGHIEKLEKHSDLAAFGRTTAKEEGGVFTKQGYLIGGDGLETLYRDSADIPDQHRLLTEPGVVKDFLMKIDDTNIPEAIIKLHAVGCKNMEHAAKNVQIFLDFHNRTVEDMTGSLLANHYLLILSRSDICVAPAMEAYKWGSDMSKFTVSMTELAVSERSDIRMFAMRTNPSNGIDDGGKAEIKGDLIELNPKSLRSHMARNAVIPDRVDALHDDGSKKSYDLYSWSELLRNQKGDAGGLFAYHYPDDDLKQAASHFGSLLGSHEMGSVAKSFEEHLPRIDAAFGDAPAGLETPHHDFIYIANEAAKEILARSDADVYRVTDTEAVKLSPIDAARSATFAEYSNLAIKHKDAAGLEAWAQRKVSDVVRKMERETERQAGRDKKNHGEEL